MRLIAIEHDTELHALAERLYPGLNQNRRRQAQEALLKANPGLEEGGTLRAGMVLSVPDLSHLGARATAHGKDPAAELLEILKTAVEGYREVLGARFDAVDADLRQQQELLRHREVAAAIDRGGAAELGRSLRGSLEAGRKALAEQKSRAGTVLQKIAEDLGKLD